MKRKERLLERLVTLDFATQIGPSMIIRANFVCAKTNASIRRGDKLKADQFTISDCIIWQSSEINSCDTVPRGGGEK